MGEVQRLSKSRDKSSRAAPSAAAAEPARASSAYAPAWAAGAMGAPFAMGGVQRKVAIGAPNDAYERQADHVAGRVVGGGTVPPGSISTIAPASIGSAAQRQSKPEEQKPDDKKKDKPAASAPVQKQAKPEEKKKEEKPAAAPVQRAVKPEDKEKDPKAAGSQLQRQSKPEEKKKDEKPAAPAPVQKQAKPEEKKKEEKPASPPVQKQSKPEEKKKDEKPAASPVQKQSKPDEKKRDEKPGAAPVQKQAKPEEKKKEEKPSPAPVQKQNKPEEKRKAEKPAAAPVQKQAKPEEKKKEEKPAAAPVQKQSKPEEKKKEDKPASAPVQKQSKPEEKKKDDKAAAAPVQRETRPEDKKKEEVPGTLPVQRAGTDQSPKKEEEAVQTSRSGNGGPSAAAAPSMESAAANAIASKGPGEPINSSTRSTLESRMGHDLSDVRVHNDSRAHESASALNARAFTHQNDIWLGRGESQHNLQLMAHEATHVVQQTGSVHRQLVQRAPTPSAGAGPGATGSSGTLKTPTGEIDLDANKMLLPQLEIPEFKTHFLKSNSYLTIPKPGSRPEGEQSQSNIWKNEVGPKAEPIAQDKLLKEVKGISVSQEGDKVTPHAETSTDPTKGVRFLRIAGSIVKGNYLVGTPAELKSQFTIPRWGPHGEPAAFDVDHQLELQLGGENTMENLWLLDAHANRSSGSKISNAIRKTVKDAIQPHAGKPAFGPTPDVGLARQRFEITYEKVVAGPNPPGSDSRWLKDDVEKVDKPFAEVKPVPETEARKLIGNKGSLAIYPLTTGGSKKDLPWDVNKPEKPFPAEDLGFIGIKPGATIKYTAGGPGSIQGTFRPKKAKKGVIKEKPITLTLNEVGGIPYTLTVERNSLMQSMQYMEAGALSPIEMKEIDMEEGRGFVARGKLAPSIPLFKKLDIDITIDGNDVTLSKTFTKNDFNLPGPIKIPEASLTLSLGTGGLSAEGVVQIEIERLGKGEITAGVSSQGGLELTGSFDFDKTLFDPANVHVEYKDGKFSGGGKIGIKSGKVKGIKSASIEAKFSDGAIDATGSITPDIPAVEQADLSMHYDEKAGLTIGGDLELKKDIPGIAGGSVHAEVTKKDDRYIVKASGKATPKIPGISSELVVSYDDGAFDATITAGYEKGMLKGSVTVGATNRPVDDSGKPGEAPSGKADKITVYGGGSVTLKLAPWLQATAAIKFKPNGEVEVTGKIGLPDVLDIFDEKKVEKNIFKIGIDIPVFPGIELDVGGGLDVSAGIGPGQLQQVEVDVTYNPDHEDETNVHGHAALHIPAHAGLRMNVHAGLGVGIPLAKVEGGIELGGSLGVEGALHAAVDIDWSPKKGLVLDASAEIYAEPKLKFDVTGYVEVVVGIGWLSKTLWEKRWELAAVEYGSGLRFGLKLPIHYEEGKPFNVSLSDIQFEVPNVDPMDVIKGLFDKIKGSTSD